jgi:hypothetical protein
LKGLNQEYHQKLLTSQEIQIEAKKARLPSPAHPDPPQLTGKLRPKRSPFAR